MEVKELQENLHNVSKSVFEMEKKTKPELIEEIEYLLNLTNTQHKALEMLSHKKQRISTTDMIVNSILGTILAILILKLLELF